MKKHQKLQKILDQLDCLYSELKSLKVSKSTLDSLNKACEEVELELRESLSNRVQFNKEV